MTDRREKMANQLLMRGHATMKELLTVSFGEWPPKGLDMNPGITHEQKVEIRPMLYWLLMKMPIDRYILQRLSGIFATAGKILDDDEKRNIYISFFFGVMGSFPFFSVLGHEAVHVLQKDHSDRLKQVFGDKAQETVWKADRRFCTSQSLMRELLGDQKKTGRKPNKEIDYLQQGIEVQARLHQIVAAGYPQWGRMPVTMDELWLVMVGAGVQPVAEVSKRLGELSPDDAAGSFYSVIAEELQDKGSEIQKVYASLSPEQKSKFWHRTLPGLYADLLEMYGDRLGRERFFPGQKNSKRDFVQRPDPIASP